MWHFIFAISVLTSPVQSEALSKPWLKLLRYKKSLLSSSWQSQVDDASFFLSARGKHDPIAEFEATQTSFQNTPETKCRFPARYLLINGRTDQSYKDLEACSEFQRFKGFLIAPSVSLVFSSYFLNNPSSAFGHSFLRFNQWSDSAHPELLDHAIDFAASVDTQNALIYGVKGIFGLFRGEFSLKPYFMQVRQYSAFESRDLWSYKLRFSPEEVRYLIAHLWEVGQSWIDYYYFDENCSYHILGALEVVRPEKDLTNELGPYVIPIDTVKVLIKHDLVDEPDFRPSIKTVLDHRLRRLPNSAIDKIRLWTNLKEPISDSASIEDAETLDAALDYLSFRHPYEVQIVGSAPAKRRIELGRIRADLGRSSPPLALESFETQRPDLVHRTSLISLRAGHSELEKTFVSLRWRPVFHDFLDPGAGFPSYAMIEFFDTSVRWSIERRRFLLENLTAFQVYSLAPWEPLLKPLSWRLRVGAQTLPRDLCEDCLAGSIEGGVGLSISTLSLLLEAEATFQPALPGSWGYIGIGPGVLWRGVDGKRWGLVLKGNYRYKTLISRAKHAFFSQLSLRYSLNSRVGIVGELGSIGKYLSLELGGRYYF